MLTRFAALVCVGLIASGCRPTATSVKSPFETTSTASFAVGPGAHVTAAPSEAATAAATTDARATPTLTPATPTATPTFAESPPRSGNDWRESNLELGFLLRGLVANRLGYVIFGDALDASGSTDGSLLGLFNLGIAFSRDGSTWQSVPIAGDLSGAMGSTAAASEDLFLIAGTSSTGYGAWISGDGMTWSFHPIDVNGFTSFHAIAAGRAGFLGVGSSSTGSADATAAAWLSPDGITWRGVAVPPTEDIVAIAPYADGFIAIGSQPDALIHERTLYSAWTTTDGSAWHSLGSFPDQVCCRPTAVAANADAAIAVGAGDCDEGLIGAGWYANGVSTWSRVPHTGSLENSYLWAVQPFGGGFLSVGTRGSKFNDSSVGVWTSDDGTVWTMRAVLSEPGAWVTEGPALGPAGIAIIGSSSRIPDFSASPPPTFSASDVSEDVMWLLPSGASPGEVADESTSSNGCNTTRVGLGWRAAELESYLSTGVPLKFEDATTNGQRVRRGTNAAGTVEVIEYGDTADIERVEVFGRNTEKEAGAAFAAIEWMLPQDANYDEMYGIVDGTTQHAETTTESVLITGDRLNEGDWQYEFVVTPAS